MALRDYQSAAVDALWQYFTLHDGNPLVAMPTGTGKSHVTAGFIQRACCTYWPQRIMILTHVEELIRQNHAKLLEAWPTAPAGVYSASMGRKEHQYPITFAGIASVHRYPALFGHVDLVIIDEAHLVNVRTDTMYSAFLKALRTVNPKLKVVGLSATCFRMGTGHLTNGGLFTDVAFDLTTIKGFTWLLQQGYMAPLVTRRTAYQFDLEGLRRDRFGEFVQQDLTDKVDNDDVTYAALQEVCEAGADRASWLAFGFSVHHVEEMVRILHSLGVDAVPIHSKLSSDVRRQNYTAFKNGDVRCAVSMNAMTTGIDVPQVDLLAVLRPTNSAALWVQMLGRGTRPVYASGHDLATADGRHAAMQASGKVNCLALDFAGNTARLGPINDPVLPKPPGMRKGAPGAAPVKVCPVCSAYNHTLARQCEACGLVFERHVNINPTASGLEVMSVLVDPPTVKALDVAHVTYVSHEPKRNRFLKADDTRRRPPVLRVTYFMPNMLEHKPVTEFVLLQSDGAARARAEAWWRARAGKHADVPDTVEEALVHVNTLRVPKKVNVWVNKKPYPEVMSHEY